MTSVTYPLAYKLVAISSVVGFLGDASLQVLCQHMGGPTGWGLKEYFQQHGSAESMFIASGMMSLFYIFYLSILLWGKYPITWFGLAVYGIVLDFLFRKTMIFESLKGYYNHLNYFWSAVWGAIPLVLPFAVYHLFSKTN